MTYLIIFILGLCIGWLIGTIIPSNINLPLFLKMIMAYLPCKIIYFNYGINKNVTLKIHAIKKYREITGQNLPESKNQIERWFE